MNLNDRTLRWSDLSLCSRLLLGLWAVSAFLPLAIAFLVLFVVGFAQRPWSDSFFYLVLAAWLPVTCAIAVFANARFWSRMSSARHHARRRRAAAQAISLSLLLGLVPFTVGEVPDGAVSETYVRSVVLLLLVHAALTSLASALGLRGTVRAWKK